MTTWTEHDSRRLTVAFVAIDGHRMRLRGDERAEAIRAMRARGLDTKTIAERLYLSVEALHAWASKHGIPLPSVQPSQPWWVEVACPSSATRNRRRQKQAQRARAATTTRSHL